MRLVFLSVRTGVKTDEALRDQINRELVYRSFQFDKRSQYFFGADDKTFSVAMRVSAKHRSPVGNVIETHEHTGDFKNGWSP